jgi:hypothetical protein
MHDRLPMLRLLRRWDLGRLLGLDGTEGVGLVWQPATGAVCLIERRSDQLVRFWPDRGSVRATPLGIPGARSHTDLTSLVDTRLCLATCAGPHLVLLDSEGAVLGRVAVPPIPWRIAASGSIAVACLEGSPPLVQSLCEVDGTGELIARRVVDPPAVSAVPITSSGALGFVLERRGFELLLAGPGEDSVTPLFRRVIEFAPQVLPNRITGTPHTLFDAQGSEAGPEVYVLCSNAAVPTGGREPAALVRVVPGRTARAFGVPEECERFVMLSPTRLLAMHSSLQIPNTQLLEFEVPDWLVATELWEQTG